MQKVGRSSEAPVSPNWSPHLVVPLSPHHSLLSSATVMDHINRNPRGCPPEAATFIKMQRELLNRLPRQQMTHSVEGHTLATNRLQLLLPSSSGLSPRNRGGNARNPLSEKHLRQTSALLIMEHKQNPWPLVRPTPRILNLEN